MTPNPATQIDGYELLSHLGSGGLGDVFLARRSSTGGKVAIKFLRDTENQTDLDRRLRRELEALIELKGHPAVVNVEDVVRSLEGPALVMEYVPGGSLHGALGDRGPFDVDAVCELGYQVAALLSDAHGLGIIHRDIKPQNILITAFGTYKVCDFGIAALTKSADWAERTNSLSYRYASPEELHGVEVDGQADVYSLGVTLIQARTGETAGARLVGHQPYQPVDHADDVLATLLGEMVLTEAADRPTPADVARRLRALQSTDRRGRSDDTTEVRPRPVPRLDTGPSRSGRSLPHPTTQANWWE